MALSVSGFPEPSRQSTSPNEISNGDTSQDGYTKATLMNSPRLRGLFGTTNVPAKKPDTKNQSTSSKVDTEGDSNPYSVNNTTPPATPSLSFHSSSFEPLSQQEYELELQLPTGMNAPFDPPRASSSKRAQLPPLPRKVTPSPVRLSPNLARLEIGGAWARPQPTSNTHSKPSPPSVVVQEWGAKGAEPSSSSTQQSRPLPSVPGNSSESGTLAPNAVAGPSRLPSASTVPMPIAGPSRNTNAFASSSNHVNAVAGSSKHPNALMSSSLPSPTITASPPPSKVLITQPTPHQGHKSNSPSLSMRYQPLVADLSVPSSDVVSNNFTSTSSPIRPLPRIPPTTSTSAAKAPDSSRYHPPPAKVKRPKTSPSSITGFSTPTGSKTAPTSLSRSPFDNITTTWVRPGDRNLQRANSPPLPISNGKGLPRARSHSRTRRDRSLDSSNTRAAAARLTASSSPGGSTWVREPYKMPLKRMPSPTIGGARPLPKKAATLDYISHNTKPLQIQTSNVTTTTASKVFSPTGHGKRSQPPSPPTGPVKQRTKPTPSPVASPTIHAPTPNVTSRTLHALLTDATVLSPPIESAKQPTQQDELSVHESQSMVESPLHSHPIIDVLTDSESLLHPPVSPNTADSPIEVFVDDQDLSTMSRDHSPIRYARPDSRGNLSSSSNEDDFDSSSSSSSSRSSSPNRRRRTEQLRSYRNSYRPHGRISPPHIPYPPENSTSLSAAPPEQPTEAEKAEKAGKKKKEGRKVRSYFGGAASAPGTRASSPERKSRSRQPRRLAEAVSSALEDVRNRGRGASSSPRRKSAKAPMMTAPAALPASFVEPAPLVEESEVLDISLPSLSRRETSETTETTSSSTSENVGGTGGSGKWSNAGGLGWARVISKRRTETEHSSSGSLSVPHLTSNLVTAVELDGAETPYMWVSTSKPPVPPAPFIPPPPPPPHHLHRRTDSLNVDDYQVAGNRQQLDIEVDRHGVTCGLALGGGGGGPGLGGKSKPTDIVTTSSSISRPASSSITTTFSNFSLTGRNNTKKKKRTGSVTGPTPSSASAAEESFASHMEKDASSYRTRKYSEKSYPSESDLPAVVARRILRSVNQDGDVHEREQETAVVDIIPHLRNLKASKS